MVKSGSQIKKSVKIEIQNMFALRYSIPSKINFSERVPMGRRWMVVNKDTQVERCSFSKETEIVTLLLEIGE